MEDEVARGDVMGETATSEGTTGLLERRPQLSMPDEWFRGVSSSSRGGLVLVGGEAGVGKTMLLRRFCEQCGPPSVWGGCEPLFTPRPLGPLLDVAEQTGGELAEVVAGGKRPHDV